MNYPQTLVLMDTDRIKEYIFASNRLKEIRGASLLLDRLNRSQSRALLQEHGGREIFIGGGGILATFGDAVQAKKYLQAVQRIYFQETEIASITGITEQITDPNDEQNALQRARVALRMAKGARLLPPLLGSSYFQICSSCNRHPVAETSDQERLCKACVKKREAAKMAPESDEEAQTTSGLFPDYTAYKKFAQRAEKKHTDSRWQTSAISDLFMPMSTDWASTWTSPEALKKFTTSVTRLKKR